jgi:parvulin-like peptidyl-prolyl isomerase
MLLLWVGGCDGNKKSALTEEEIRQRTLATKRTRPNELIVSGEIVTCDDITAASFDAGGPSLKEALLELARQTTLPQFMELARPQMRQRLNGSITNVILYRRAARQLGEQADEQLDKMAEKELRRFILEHGDDGAAADAALQGMGMDRERFKEHWKKRMLREYYVTSKFPYNRPITHSEMLDTYDKMKAEDFSQAGLLQFRLIDIDITKVRLSEGDDDPLQVARNLAKALMEKIRAGADFGELARAYSNDYRSVEGGLWPARDPEALAAPYDVLAKKARDMKPGEVAGPIETLGHVFIMKVEQKQEKGYRPYAEVQDRVEEQIRMDRRAVALKQLDAEIAQQVTLADTSAFVDRCLEGLYRQARAGQPAQ